MRHLRQGPIHLCVVAEVPAATLADLGHGAGGHVVTSLPASVATGRQGGGGGLTAALADLGHGAGGHVTTLPAPAPVATGRQAGGGGLTSLPGLLGEHQLLSPGVCRRVVCCRFLWLLCTLGL